MKNDKMVSVPFKALRDFLEHSACTYKGPEWTKNKAALRHAMSAPVERQRHIPRTDAVYDASWASESLPVPKCVDAIRPVDPGKEILAIVESSLRRSFNLGQLYWQQADSDSTCQQNKSDQTMEVQAQHILNVVKSIKELTQ